MNGLALTKLTNSLTDQVVTKLTLFINLPTSGHHCRFGTSSHGMFWQGTCVEDDTWKVSGTHLHSVWICGLEHPPWHSTTPTRGCFIQNLILVPPFGIASCSWQTHWLRLKKHMVSFCCSCNFVSVWYYVIHSIVSCKDDIFQIISNLASLKKIFLKRNCILQGTMFKFLFWITSNPK